MFSLSEMVNSATAGNLPLPGPRGNNAASMGSWGFVLGFAKLRLAKGEKFIMPNIDRWFLRVAVIYALVAMLLGIVMGVSEDHSQMPTHAHLNLVGWVSMAIYALVYRQYPAAGQGRLALAHFWVANIGAVLLNVGVYGLMAGNSSLELIAIAGSLITILGMLIFAGIVYTKV